MDSVHSIFAKVEQKLQRRKARAQFVFRGTIKADGKHQFWYSNGKGEVRFVDAAFVGSK